MRLCGVLALGLVVLGACGNKGEEKPVERALPEAGAADARSTSSAGAVDAASGASQVVAPPVVVPGARAIQMERPLRGTKPWGAPVFVAQGDDAAAMVKRALDDLKPNIPAGARVVVIVNVGGYDRIKKGKKDDGFKGRTTNPDVVRALLVELRARGAKQLFMAGGASNSPEEFRRVVEYSGYAALSKELDVPFLDLNHYGEGDDRPLPWRVKLPWANKLTDELILSDDLVHPGRKLFLVDVPKIKAHRFAVMTVAIKNLMSAVMMDNKGSSQQPWQRRWRMHRELSPWLKGWKKTKADNRAQYKKALLAFADRLADLYGALTPDLVVADGMPAMQGDGFAKVIPFGGGVIMASANACYVDYVAAELFGLHDSDALEAELGVRRPPAITACANRFFGGADKLPSIEVRGDVAWRTTPNRPVAWFKAMAPFEINKRPR